MAKIIAVKVAGEASGITIEGNRAYGFDEVTWLEADGNLKDAKVTDNIAVTDPVPERPATPPIAVQRVAPSVKGHPLLTRAFRKRRQGDD